jgi:hypothetical protein
MDIAGFLKSVNVLGNRALTATKPNTLDQSLWRYLVSTAECYHNGFDFFEFKQTIPYEEYHHGYCFT